MDERSAKIAEGLSSAEEATKCLAEVKQDAQQLLREAQLQAEASMKAAIAEAEGVRSERLAKTEREIEALLERSRHEIAQDRATAFVSLKKELADMVMLATGKIVGSLTDKQVDEKAVAQALVDLERV
jgi:F-type H+-transporting ATPase subunit b